MYMNLVLNNPTQDRKITVEDYVVFMGKYVALFDSNNNAYVFHRKSRVVSTLSTMLTFNSKRVKGAAKKFATHKTVLLYACHPECVKVYTFSKNINTKLPRSPVCKKCLKIKKSGVSETKLPKGCEK